MQVPKLIQINFDVLKLGFRVLGVWGLGFKMLLEACYSFTSPLKASYMQLTSLGLEQGDLHSAPVGHAHHGHHDSWQFRVSFRTFPFNSWAEMSFRAERRPAKVVEPKSSRTHQSSSIKKCFTTPCEDLIKVYLHLHKPLARIHNPANKTHPIKQINTRKNHLKTA